QKAKQSFAAVRAQAEPGHEGPQGWCAEDGESSSANDCLIHRKEMCFLLGERGRSKEVVCVVQGVGGRILGGRSSGRNAGRSSYELAQTVVSRCDPPPSSVENVAQPSYQNRNLPHPKTALARKHSRQDGRLTLRYGPPLLGLMPLHLKQNGGS